MYVAGTRSMRDIADDFLIPFGLTRRSSRGIAAESMYGLYHPSRVVGHSLGGAVALDVAEDHHIKSTTYGAPLASFSTGDRYRDVFDPVSMFDFGATNRVSLPHSYRGYGRLG